MTAQMRAACRGAHCPLLISMQEIQAVWWKQAAHRKTNERKRFFYVNKDQSICNRVPWILKVCVGSIRGWTVREGSKWDVLNTQRASLGQEIPELPGGWRVAKGWIFSWIFGVCCWREMTPNYTDLLDRSSAATHMLAKSQKPRSICSLNH